MKIIKYHKKFKLNGLSFVNEQEMLLYAKTLSKPLFIFLSDWFSSLDYVVVQTSGSTGVPKPIQLQKEFMKNSAIATGVFFNLPENTKALLCLSVDYIAGKMMLVRALTLGWDIDIVAPVANPLVKNKKNYDFSAMVPMQLQASIASLYSVKKIIVGGGVVSMDLQKEIQSLPTQIYATYGMTETITHIAVKKLNNVGKSTFFNESNSSVSFYKTLPNVTIYKDDRNCLLIKAPQVSNDIIVTNDVVKLVSNDEFVWLGRFDNVINSGGVKLHPEKIEEKLAVLIKPRFFVAGVKDTILGERLIIVIEGKQQHIDFSRAEKLSKYEIPKETYFIDHFVDTETKKIQRLKTLELINL